MSNFNCRFCGNLSHDGDAKNHVCINCMRSLFKCDHVFNCINNYNCSGCNYFLPKLPNSKQKENVVKKTELTTMEKARKISLALCIAAAVIISGYINIYGGISIIVVNYEEFGNIGIGLLVSSLFLIAGLVIAGFQKVWVPAIFNIIGTVAYIYSVSQLYSIPNSLLPKVKTEPLAERHLFTVIVTVLLMALTFFNFFSDENVKKRQERRNKKLAEQNRSLTDSEKII